MAGAGTTTCFAPREGMSVLFPSWLEHYVLPHSCNCTLMPVSGRACLSLCVSVASRISIAFNAKVAFPSTTPPHAQQLAIPDQKEQTGFDLIRYRTRTMSLVLCNHRAAAEAVTRGVSCGSASIYLVASSCSCCGERRWLWFQRFCGLSLARTDLSRKFSG